MFTTGEQDHGLAHQCKQSSAGTSLHPAVRVRLTAVSDEAHPRGGRGLLRCDASHGASPLLLRTIPVTGLLARTHPNAKSEIRCLACANMHPQQGVAAAMRAANFSRFICHRAGTHQASTDDPFRHVFAAALKLARAVVPRHKLPQKPVCVHGCRSVPVLHTHARSCVCARVLLHACVMITSRREEHANAHKPFQVAQHKHAAVMAVLLSGHLHLDSDHPAPASTRPHLLPRPPPATGAHEALVPEKGIDRLQNRGGSWWEARGGRGGASSERVEV